MRLLRNSLLILLVISVSILYCGCWNYEDIEKMLGVSGFSIDKTPNGDRYLLTIEVADFEMSGKDAKETSKYIESEGATIFDAIRNAIDITGRKLYWAHTKIVVINKKIAEEGLIPVIDFINRDTEMREEMYVVISKGETAKEILTQNTLLSQASSINIERMLSNQNRVGNAHAVKAYELVGTLQEDGISVTLPAIEIKEQSGKKSAELSGTAIFKDDKLVGYIDTMDTKVFLFIINEFRKGLITIKEDSINNMDNVTLEIFKTSTKLKPEYTNKKLAMNIEIKPTVAIAEMGTPADYIKEGKNRDKLQKDAEKKLEESAANLIKKVQNEFDSDIFGFGAVIKKNMPSIWKYASVNKLDVFKGLRTNIIADFTIINSALVSKPIKKGD